MKIDIACMYQEINAPIINKIDIQEGDSLITYEGRAYNLWFEGFIEKGLKIPYLGIRGIASLIKYVRPLFKEHKRIKSLFPFKTEIIKKPIVMGNELEWKVLSDNRFDISRFIINGRIEEEKWGYRGDLKCNAATQGLLLSPKLLDLVFNPIDQQVYKLYQKARYTEK